MRKLRIIGLGVVRVLVVTSMDASPIRLQSATMALFPHYLPGQEIRKNWENVTTTRVAEKERTSLKAVVYRAVTLPQPQG